MSQYKIPQLDKSTSKRDPKEKIRAKSWSDFQEDVSPYLWSCFEEDVKKMMDTPSCRKFLLAMKPNDWISLQTLLFKHYEPIKNIFGRFFCDGSLTVGSFVAYFDNLRLVDENLS